MNYVYMLRCGDGSLYTGWTNDMEKRLAAHRNGTGAKYTRGRKPLTLAYLECLPDKSSALRREAAIKKLPRTQKEALIAKQQSSKQLTGSTWDDTNAESTAGKDGKPHPHSNA